MREFFKCFSIFFFHFSFFFFFIFDLFKFHLISQFIQFIYNNIFQPKQWFDKFLLPFQFREFIYSLNIAVKNSGSNLHHTV